MKMSTSRAILVAVVCMVFFESIALTSYFLVNTNSQVVQNTERSMHEVLVSNANMIDTVMMDMVDRAERICVDKNMRELVQTLHSEDLQKKLYWSDTMRKTVFNYFGSMVNNYEEYILDINIFSEDFSYSDRNLFTYEYESFVDSELNVDALNQRPYYYWVPTMNARSMLSNRMQTYILGTSDQISTDVIRLIKRMNISSVEGDTIYKLTTQIPSPYIVVSIDPKLLSDVFSKEGLTANSQYMVVDTDGRIVSCDDPSQNGGVLECEPLLQDMRQKPTEFCSGTYLIGNEQTLVCYMVAESSDWYYVCLLPQSDISNQVEHSVKLYILLLAGTLLVTLLLSVYFVLRTTKPVRDLARKADIIAAKDGVLTSSGRETDRIMTVIESMNEQIEQLTVDNVDLERREREANILMLEMQINPHFLYNSLNKLHISLLKAGEDEIAGRVIALSRALRYSVDARAHLVYLHQDIEQLKLYLSVVQSARENSFAVYYDIEDALFNSIVPKMLLQPFVENSIIHGFRDMAFGCMIYIEGRQLQEGDVVYTVTDNGAGIPEEKRDMLLSGIGGHIGCSNVHKRIQLLFGKEYGVTVESVPSGTRISIRLPCIFEG